MGRVVVARGPGVGVVVAVCRAGVGAPRGRERRAVVRDPAVAHHHGPVDQRRQRAELVGDQHDRGAPVRAAAQRVGEGLLVGQVDAGGGLVEEEQVGLAGQRPRDQRALLLAAGERGDAVAGLVGEPDRRRARRRSRPGRPRERAAAAGGGSAGRTATTSHTDAGTPPAALGALRHEADPLPRRRTPSSGRAEEPHLAAAQGRAARSARGPAWTCRSRWRPSARRTRPARRRGRCRAGSAGRRARRRRRSELDDRVHGHEHPFAFSRAARFARIRDR